jgi:hypothetical protein
MYVNNVLITQISTVLSIESSIYLSRKYLLSYELKLGLNSDMI